MRQNAAQQSPERPMPDAQPQQLVLVLEDDPRAAEALTMLLGDWGYQCAHAAGVDGLLPVMEQRAGEVVAIISDYHLQGGRTGLEAIEQARKAGVRAPALLLTATLRGEARRAAEAAGHRFMEKPVQADRVKVWLDKAVLR